ncbi:MAG: glycosyl hydrolase family 18 protein, partial [Bacteroidota bacterium]
AYWSGYRNWPAEKLVLGLPLYGRNFNDGGTSLAYRLILADTPAVALADYHDRVYYNGRPTIEAKARYVSEREFAGVMLWQIAHDTTATELSLTAAVADVFACDVAPEGC